MKSLPVKPTIKFEDLEKLDIRVGTIEKVEDVEGSDKLVRLKVNFGEFQRTILVGMKKERENPQEIEGKQALFVVNLEPRKMMGELSEACSLISVIPTKSPLSSQSPKKKYLMESMQDKQL